MSAPLDYAIVIATRNRLEALRASIPLFLAQTRPPVRIHLVDRSDDHQAVVDFINEVAAGTSIPLTIEWGEAANLPAQRNQGIAGITEPVTCLPDDDSLWFPDTAERLMAVYDADPGARIGGVSGRISTVSPLARTAAPANARRLVRTPWIEATRNRIEERFAPQPFNIYARLRQQEILPKADALLGPLIDPEAGGAKPVETMSGWRMSYRTAVVQSLRFDPTLGSRAGYGQHEDKDMSLRAQKAGYLLVAAPGAQVFHNVAPGRRAGGFAYGFLWLFNYTYICRKVFGSAPPGRGAVKRYMGYKALLYRLRRSSTYNRDVAKGAAVAMAVFDELWSALDPDLTATYAEISGRVLNQTSA